MKDVLMRMLEVGFILGILWLCTGCHTVEGVGMDLQDWSAAYTDR